MEDYQKRSYLSAGEAAKYLSISVGVLHRLIKEKIIDAQIAASGQIRWRKEVVL